MYREHLRRVDRAGFQELVRERPPELRHRIVERTSVEQNSTDQRVAVRMQSAGLESDQDVTLADATGPNHARFADHADTEPRKAELVVGHPARMLRRLPADKRASGAPAPLGDA